MDAEFDGIATGLSNTICRDGQSTVSANIPFNNHKITGLADATTGTDALNRQSADTRYGVKTKLLATGATADSISTTPTEWVAVEFVATSKWIMVHAHGCIQHLNGATIVDVSHYLQLRNVTLSADVTASVVIPETIQDLAESSIKSFADTLVYDNLTVGSTYRVKHMISQSATGSVNYITTNYLAGFNF